MAYLNIGQVLLAAACKVSAATPPVVTDAVNIAAASVTRTNAGIWVVNLDEPIDFANRWAIPVANNATGANMQLDPAVQTDATIGVLGFDLAVPGAVDAAWQLTVWRCIIL